jgi:ClpP class serine protease
MAFTPRSERRNAPLRVLAQIYDKPWAITSEALQTILDVLSQPQDLEAVAAKLGRPLDNNGNSATVRDGVAILNVEGPLFRYANLFTDLSGATSVEGLAQDFQSALDAPNVKQILLNINSPGGQVDGIQELGDMIRAGTQTKPVTAYIEGTGASAAYWLAAAAQHVAAAESALIGSVGVVAAVTDNREAQQRQGVRRYEIVSSQSPYKRPDVATEEGRAQILEVVDGLADIFIGRLAAFRGVTADHVAANFGKGKTVLARQAIAAGMADEITGFEPLAARLAADRSPRAYSFSAHQEVQPMAEILTTQPPAPQPPAQPVTPPAPAAAALNPPAMPAPVAAPPPQPAVTLDPAGVATERTRIAAILNAPEAQGREALARTLALETNQDPESARRILAAAPTAQPPAAPPVNQLAAEMAKLGNPKVGAGTGEGDTAASEAARVLAFIPKAQRYAS